VITFVFGLGKSSRREMNMFRHVAATAIVLCLSPVSLWAQGTTITVNAASADVYKAPSTGSPIVGNVSRGAVLEVTRELGSWVKVPWAKSPDGSAYIHVSMGSIAHNVTPAALPAGAPRGASPAQAGDPASGPSSVHADVDQINRRLSPLESSNTAINTRTSVPVAPTTHALGFGGKLGAFTSSSMPGIGVSARTWRRNRLGVQLEVSRDLVSSAALSERLTSSEFEPGVLYALRDHVSDYVWWRPYVGGGVPIRRQTLSSTIPGVELSQSQGGMGIRPFGGGEFTFSAMPQFAVSADLGYEWVHNPVAGFDTGGLGLTLSGHWYLR
jgi:hypothetical protein